MKNTDIALVVMIALVTTVAAYFLGNAILGDPNNNVTTVSYIDVIDSDVDEPDVESFNIDALNPTVEVYVGNCGPMEVWDANAKVCRSKIEDSSNTSSDTTEDEESSDDEDESQSHVDKLQVDDDTADVDTGE